MSDDNNDGVVEALAGYAHNAWAGWMAWLFSVSIENDDGTVTIPVELVKRWKRQIDTPYVDLPKEEKGSDRAEAYKILFITDRELT